MRKGILSAVLAVLLAFGTFAVSADENSVVALDGNITISCTVDAPEGTPVLVCILPAIVENNTDVTASKVQAITTQEMIKNLNVEYMRVVYLGEGGSLNHLAKTKNSLSTGTCHVVISHLGSDNCYSIGTFEHVGEDDKQSLLSQLNAADKDTCESIILEDIYGVFEEDGVTLKEAPKEILRKSSADVAYYLTLTDESVKDEFYALLYKLKGAEDFDMMSLVEAFNESTVWVRLRNEADTLSVLSTYNGEDGYWSLDIGEGSDFDGLPAEEKAQLLSDIKTHKYEDRTPLEADFHSKLVLALFRSVTTREELSALISADGDYAEDFASVRTIIAGADLGDSYDEALVFNSVVDGAALCKTMEDVEKLFTDSIPEGDKGGSSGSPVGTTGGFKGNYDKEDDTAGEPVESTKPSNNALPFTDVSDKHWAKDYISYLYTGGTINGVSANSFAPEVSVTRQDFVKILLGAIGIETEEYDDVFSDVGKNAYYAPYVMTAYNNGLIAGTGDGTFGVGLNIKREDAAVIIDRVLAKYSLAPSGEAASFADSGEISSYARDAATRVSAAGIFAGDDKGNFNPKASLTRAQACAILYRLAELIKEV